jgi:hypothetical protein
MLVNNNNFGHVHSDRARGWMLKIQYRKSIFIIRIFNQIPKRVCNSHAIVLRDWCRFVLEYELGVQAARMWLDMFACVCSNDAGKSPQIYLVAPCPSDHSAVL